MLDSVFEAKKKYYPQVFLEECKHEPKRIKRENLINDDLEKTNLIVILMMRQNLILIMKKKLQKATKSILITIKAHVL